MHKIVMLDRPRENPGELDWSPLQELGAVTIYDHTTAEQAAERIGDADIVLMNKTVISADTLRKCPNLRFISVIATGYNTLDVQCCRELGIQVSNVPGYGSEAISQHAVALLLELTNGWRTTTRRFAKAGTTALQTGASGTTPFWSWNTRPPESSVWAGSGKSRPGYWLLSA